MRLAGWVLAGWLFCGAGAAQVAKRPDVSCRTGMIEGELNAGVEFTQPIGNGLRLWFEPIRAGWILRVVPLSGPVGEHDYAELATPPYRSVTPLSLSTDFAFRAQDAVGWNPRRFRFATSAKEFSDLNQAYGRLMDAGTAPSAGLQAELAKQIAKAAEGKLTIVDARLVGGVADQWRMAAAVSERFTQTAHTLIDPADGRQSPLGHLLWVRFRVEMNLPANFRTDAGLKVVPQKCGTL